MPFLIYKITNAVNDKLYIGCTTNSIHRRWKGHLSLLRHRNQYMRSALYDAMKEEGIDKFSIEQIEECPDKKVMMDRERYWIRRLDCLVPNGYNLYIRLLTDEQIAIVRFNAYRRTIREYADLFNVSRGVIQVTKTGKGIFYDSDPYAYITHEYLPIQFKKGEESHEPPP